MVLLYVFGIAAAIVIGLALATRWQSRRIEARFPADGAFAHVDGVDIHYRDIPAGAGADLAPLVFIHGVGGNSRDLEGAFAAPLAGRARMIFVDRPGAGYSGRSGPGDADPARQAAYLAGLMRAAGLPRAVIVGHSFGAAVATAFAVDNPRMISGLVVVAPASHPWPGGKVNWYWRPGSIPLIGQLFAHVLAGSLGGLLYRRALGKVFAPDRVPADYPERSGTQLALRPASYLANCEDIGALNGHLARLAGRYRDIAAPTVIIAGDSDGTVSTDLHARALARDIAGSRLVVIPDGGHLPTYAATGLIVNEIAALNRRVAADAQIPERPSLAT